MSTALKPCPFCGYTRVEVNTDLKGHKWVLCQHNDCLAAGPVRTSWDSTAVAWNCRASVRHPTGEELTKSGQVKFVAVHEMLNVLQQEIGKCKGELRGQSGRGNTFEYGFTEGLEQAKRLMLALQRLPQ